MKKTVAIIFGGVSSEHEVSCKSAASVLRNINTDKYEIIKVGITADGRWLETKATPDAVETGGWEKQDNAPAFISPDRSVHGIIHADGSSTRVDVVFPVLHGRNGEDGSVQGLFQLAGIPFVGCDMLSSAACMDKAVTNTMLEYFGIPRSPWSLITDLEMAQFDVKADEWENNLGYPMFVKPANAGSSVGITKAHNREELKNAVLLALKHDRKVVIEQNVSGKELEIGVMGNDNPVASPVGEIFTANEFYDYDAKYNNAASKTRVPADISDELRNEIEQTAIKTYRSLGCAGFARVDFLYDTANKKLYVNELNTIPGFTNISMYPQMFMAAGMTYSEIIDRLLSLAQERR